MWCTWTASCRPRTGTLARIAHVETGEDDLGLDTREDVLKRYLNLGLEIVSPNRLPPASTATATGVSPEDVVEHREDVLDVHRPEVMSRSGTQTISAESIVSSTPLRIGKDSYASAASLKAASAGRPDSDPGDTSLPDDDKTA